MTKKQSKDRARDHNNISFTADYHPWFKTFYELPYTWEIYEFVKAQPGVDARGNADLAIIPVFEARCKGTDAAIRRYVELQGIRQILSVAAGMEQRGIAITSDPKYPGMIYVETDISDIFQKKPALADAIFKKYNLPNRRGLHFHTADATILEQLLAATEEFSPDKKVIIVHEGLSSYYSEAENRVMIKHSKKILERFGGVLITSDPSMNRENRNIFMSHIANFKETTDKIAQRTGRSYDEKGFRDNEHAYNFYMGEGLIVKRFGQDDLGYTLNSLDKVGLDSETAKTVAENIRKTMQVWVMSIK